MAQMKTITGLGLLHDFNFASWLMPNKIEELNKMYVALDRFDATDARFIPYWENGEFIKGQTRDIKCSVYVKKSGNILLCAMNLSPQLQNAELHFDFEKLLSFPGISNQLHGKGCKYIGHDVLQANPNPPLYNLNDDSLKLKLLPLDYRLIKIYRVPGSDFVESRKD